jgi:tetratricopeptide (TPR) repeat protein
VVIQTLRKFVCANPSPETSGGERAACAAMRGAAPPLLLALALCVPAGYTGSPVSRWPGHRPALRCRLRGGSAGVEAWQSVESALAESDGGGAWADAGSSSWGSAGPAQYKGRDVQALWEKVARCGQSRRAVTSARYDWDPILNRTEDAAAANGTAAGAGVGARAGAGAGAGAGVGAGRLGAHSSVLSAALEHLLASDADDAEEQEEDEYTLRLKFGRLKLEAQRAYGRGALEDARALYGRCLELRPDDATVLANRALVLLGLGRAEEAEDDCTAGLQVAGTGAPLVKLLYRRALARRERGRMAQALKDALEAANLEPRSPHIAKLVDELRKDEPVLRQSDALGSSNCAPRPQPESNTCAPQRADGRASRASEALLKWAGLACDKSPASASDSDPAIDDSQVLRVMDVVRCSRQEAREALFRCSGCESTAVDRLKRLGPHWLQRMGSRNEHSSSDDSLRGSDESTYLDSDASAAEDVSHWHGAADATAAGSEETLGGAGSSSDDNSEAYDRSTEELYRDTRGGLHAPRAGVCSAEFGLAGEEAVAAFARDVPVPTKAQFGPALARHAAAHGGYAHTRTHTQIYRCTDVHIYMCVCVCVYPRRRDLAPPLHGWS